MGHSLKSQMMYAIQSNFVPGVSKHALKSEGIKDFGGGIFSHSVKHRLNDVAKNFSEFIKKEYGIKQVKDIKTEHVEAYLKNKIDSGCTPTTVKGYAQSVKKLGLCCREQYGEKTKINWESDPQIYQIKHNEKGDSAMMRTLKMEEKDYQSVLKNARGCQSKECLEVCHAYGLRVEEVISIKAKDVKADSLIVSNAKGGRVRELQADTPEKRAILEKMKEKALYLGENGKLWNVNKGSVNSFLNKNLKRLGITKYDDCKTGVHSIRKNFATREYERYREKGLSHREAWGIVSSELGHGKDRMELFKVYVKAN